MFVDALYPQWGFAILACVPNFVIGVLLIKFRPQILATVGTVFPRFTQDARFWLSRGLMVGGLFLIVASSCLLAFSLSTIVV